MAIKYTEVGFNCFITLGIAISSETIEVSFDGSAVQKVAIELYKVHCDWDCINYIILG